jgi:hypothetical protein
MHRFFPFTLLVCLAVQLSAQDKLSFPIERVDRAITVDGVIDAGEWGAAKPIELAFETFPGNNVPPRVRTEAFLAYDDKTLYVGFRAHDPNPAAIRAHLTDRDRAYSDDFIGIAVDTFNDERRAFEFFVNPLGVQMDLTNNDLTGNEDDSWDAIWASAGKIHSDRWEVEMAIPFSQLRFKASADEVQTWGLDIVRIYPREQRYRIGLHAQNRDRSCYVCQMSKLTGFRGLKPGRNIEISPTVTTQRTDARSDMGQPLRQGSFDTEPGVTAKWGITPNVTLNGTINPDFSQVEADSAQLDINTTFALFFNEKRPFFLEGADFFETPFTAVYTRTIAAPDWGAKVTGKEGNHGGGLFFAKDAFTNLLLPGSQGSSLTTIDEANVAGVLRYRHDLGKNANFGALFTTRSAGDYSNRVGGIDGYWRVTEADTLRGQLLTSSTEYPLEVQQEFEQKGSLSDLAYFAQYTHSTRNWWWRASLEEAGEDFRADSGFMPRVGYQMGLAQLEHVWWPRDDQKTWWTRIFYGGDYDRTEEVATGEVLEEELETWLGIGGPKQSYVNIDVGTRNRFFNGRSFDGEKFINLFGEFTPHKRIYTSLQINAGDTIDFANTRPADRLRVQPHVRLRATRHLEVQLTHTNERLDVDGGRLFTANLTEMRAMYQFTTRMFVRALLQYTDIKRDPSLYTFSVEERSKLLFPQLLFSYKVNPQTVLFVGYSSTRIGSDQIDVTEADRTLFVKIGYAWAM